MQKFLNYLNRLRFLGAIGRRLQRIVPPQYRLAVLMVAGVALFGLLWQLTNIWVALGYLAIIGLVVLLFWGINRFVRPNRTVEGLREKEAVTDTARSWNRAVEEYHNMVDRRTQLGFYMLIGESQSGKSTTMMKSTLSLPIGMKGISGPSGTRGCDWWFTDAAIFLDTAGRLTFHDEDPDATDEQEWNWFLDRLRKFRPRAPINGVIVTIPCTSLLGDSEEQRAVKADVIRQALVDIQRRLQVRFPVYVLVTKADKVGGFAEFCSCLQARGMLQLFGWSRPTAMFEQPFKAEEIQSAFDDITRRLQEWRLLFLNQAARDRSFEERDRMFAFPRELAKLRAPLEQYLDSLFPDSRLLDPLFFRGFYISSGERKGLPIETIVEEVLGPLHVPEDEETDDKRAHFVADFYRKKVLREPGLIVSTQARERRAGLIRRIGYGAAAVLVLAGTVLFGTWLQQIWNDVDGPLDSLVNIRAAIDPEPSVDSSEPVGRPRQLTLRETQIVLKQLEKLETEIQLIEQEKSLATVGIFGGLSEGRREELITTLYRSYRVAFVYGILELLAPEISQLIAGVDPAEISSPVSFARYRQVVTFLAYMRCTDLTPAFDVEGEDELARWRIENFRALLEFCREFMPKIAFPHDDYVNLRELTKDLGVDRLVACYSVLCRNEPTYNVSDRKNVWWGTGDHIAWDGVGGLIELNILEALNKVNDRWLLVFKPADESWFEPTNDGDPIFYWFRAYSLYQDYDRLHLTLTNLEREMTQANLTTLDTWDAYARQWVELHDSLRVVDRRLGNLALITVDLSWEEAMGALNDAWDAGFYAAIRGIGESHLVKRAFANKVSDTQNELRRRWDQSQASYTSTFEQFSEKHAINLVEAGSSHGIVLNAPMIETFAAYDSTRDLMDESLAPWEDVAVDGWVGGGVLDTDGRLALRPWTQERIAEKLAVLTQRLRTRIGAEASLSQDLRNSVRRLAARAVVTRVFMSIAKTPLNPPPADPEHPLDPLAGENEPPEYYTQGRPGALLNGFLAPIIEWACDLNGELPPLRAGRGSDAVFPAMAGALDRFGDAYLRNWHEVWAVSFVEPLQLLIAECIGADSFRNFATAMHRSFHPALLSTDVRSSSVAQYMRQGLAVMTIPTPPEVESALAGTLPKTYDHWVLRHEQVMPAVEFSHGFDDSIVHDIIAMLEQIEVLGNLAPDKLTLVLMRSEALENDKQQIRLKLTPFTRRLRSLEVDAEGNLRAEALGFVLGVSQLSRLEARACELLTDIVRQEMKAAYEKMRTNLEREHGRYPFQKSDDVEEWKDVVEFFMRDGYFAKFVDVFETQLILKSPFDRIEEWLSTGRKLFIDVQPPRHVHIMVNELMDICSFVSGDEAKGEIAFSIQRIESDGSHDGAVGYVWIRSPRQARPIPHPDYRAARTFTWHFEHDTRVELWAADEPGKGALAGFQFVLPDGTNVEELDLTGRFAILRLIQEYIVPPLAQGDDGESVVTLKLPCAYRKKDGSLQVQLIFPDRLVPADVPRITAW